jgi:hypothetical protein
MNKEKQKTKPNRSRPKKYANRIVTKKSAFLAAYASVGNILRATKLARCNRAQYYMWMQDPEFAAKFREAGEQATEALEQEARRRAAEGTQKPVFYKGKVCGTVREYSDVLLIFLLKSLRPEVYRENIRQEYAGTVKLDHAGEIGLNLRALRSEVLEDAEYLEYCRNHSVNSDAGAICEDGKPGPLENGAAPVETRPGNNAHADGNGKYPQADNLDASPPRQE